jgi:poly(A) polymerase
MDDLIANERAAGRSPDGLRRLAAVLPPDPAVAEAVAARLKLSNKARKRLACAATADVDAAPQALAYRLGLECATDRLLLAGRVDDLALLEDWHSPRLPIGGGALISRGLREGPIVARTLRKIEERWIEAGFPNGDAFDKIVDRALAEAS